MVTETINVSLDYEEFDEPITIYAGKQGEGNAKQIIFNIIELMETYGENGVAELVVTRSMLDTPYVTETTQDGTSLIWNVSRTDTEKGEIGLVEIRYYVDETLAKSITYRMVVHKSISLKNLSQPLKDMLDTILALYEYVKTNMDDISQKHEYVLKSYTEIRQMYDEFVAKHGILISISKEVNEAIVTIRSMLEEIGQYASNTKIYSESAFDSMNKASQSEQNAEHYAKLSEQNASKSGYVYFDILDDGHLYMTKSESVTELTFSLNNGRMEVIYE